MPPRTILIVEDEKILMKALVKKLGHEAGFKILKAEDGEEGLKIALEKQPNLILLDIMMPKMDGITMAEELRKDSWGKTVPVIFFTNVNSDGDALNRIVASGASYCLLKCQWDLTDVAKKVDEILGESELC